MSAVTLRYCANCLIVGVGPEMGKPIPHYIGIERGQSGCLGASGGLTPGTKDHDWKSLGDFMPIDWDSD